MKDLLPWLGMEWSPDHTCLDFAVAASNAMTGWAVRNPERDPEIQRLIAEGGLPDTVPGADRIDALQRAAPGDIWILRGASLDDPLHACVVVDAHDVCDAQQARVLELSHHATSRIMRARLAARFVLARFRPVKPPVKP